MTTGLQAVILAAGMGSRMDEQGPKCLLDTGVPGETILDRQVAALGQYASRVKVVVGFMEQLVMDAHPELQFVHNSRYADTNTAVSLRLALEPMTNCDVLWLNGDVLFDPDIIPLVLESSLSCAAVCNVECGPEEVKFATGRDGMIERISKEVPGSEGEAVGINLVKASDLELFKQCLEMCGDDDYFEKAMELAVGRDMKIAPIDISRYPCIEIDSVEDLERARSLFGEG